VLPIVNTFPKAFFEAVKSSFQPFAPLAIAADVHPVRISLYVSGATVMVYSERQVVTDEFTYTSFRDALPK
jgi:hypothetical protein